MIRTPNKWWLLVAAVSASACGGGAASSGGPTSSADAPTSAEHELLGAPAPAFSLPVVSPGGKGQLDLAASQGRVRLLDFWATWCEPCRLSFPQYEKLRATYGEQLEIIAISQDDEADGIAAFARDNGITFPLLWDEGKGVSQSFRVEAMPTLFVIDQNGLVRHVHAGFREGDEKQIDAVVRSLLQ